MSLETRLRKERRMHPYFIATTSSSWLPKINILPPKADFSPGRPEHSKLFVKIMLREGAVKSHPPNYFQMSGKNIEPADRWGMTSGVVRCLMK